MASLGIDWVRLIWQMINFLILLFLLQRLLFKPILRLMDSRAAKIRESVDEAERIRALAHEAREANRAALEEARKEAADLIAAATETANQIRAQADARAREEAEHLLERAKGDIELQKEQAIADIRRQAADLAIMAASKVIEQSLSGPEHYRLVNEFLDRAEGGVN